MLLTSAGISNASIRDALVELLGRPVAECSALCVPTAIYPLPGGAGRAWNLVTGRAATPLVGLEWGSMGLLELTALPGLPAETWVPQVQAADALLVGGGDPTYLCHWMRMSGLADLLPSLPDLVYVGVSAGSLVMAPHLGADVVRGSVLGDDDAALGVVDFAMFPHLDHPDMPENSRDRARAWAAGLPVPGYAMDDQTAIRVVDGVVDVVSEGRWELFGPGDLA